MFWFNKRLRAIEQAQEKIELTEIFHKYFDNIGFEIEFDGWENYKWKVGYDLYIIKETDRWRDRMYIAYNLDKEEFIKAMWIFKLGFSQWKNLSNKELDDKGWKKKTVKK